MGQHSALSICMFSDDFLPGATGVGSHLQAMMPGLVERGHRLTIVTTRRPGEPERMQWRGVDIIRVRTLKLFGFYQALPTQAEIESILRDIKPDLVHHHYLGLMLLRAMKVCRRLRLPQVYTYHMTEDHLTQPLPMRPLRSSRH